MMPAEMIYAAMKVYEWTEGVARKERLKNEPGQNQKKKEGIIQRKAKHETREEIVPRQIRLSTDP